MGLDANLDGLGLLLRAMHAHLVVNETDEALHTIQNSLNLQLNGWSPCWMNLWPDNCRLIQCAGDQLFFFAGRLAHCLAGASYCETGCSSPTSGREQNASCLSLSEGFVLFCLSLQRSGPHVAKGFIATDSAMDSR